MGSVAAITSHKKRKTAEGVAVTVLYIGDKSTRTAIWTAEQLARGLQARIRLLVLQVVPYPLPLDRPPVNIDMLVRQLPATASIEVRLCRDRWEGLRDSLKIGGLFVIGKRSRWWPRAEDWLARRRQNAGYPVVRVSTQGRFNV